MADRKIFANQGPTKPDVPKSTFDLSHANNGTYRFGRLYPVFCYEAPAGSSFRIKPYVGFDMHPLAFPIQSNVRCHMSFYKIPLRILWKHYRDFVGQHAADGSIATSDTQYRIPYISRSENWHKTGSLADYMGLPSVSYSEAIQRRMRNRTMYFDNFAGSTFSEFRIDASAGLGIVHSVEAGADVSPELNVYKSFIVDGISLFRSNGSPQSSKEVYIDLFHHPDAVIPAKIQCVAAQYVPNNNGTSQYSSFLIPIDGFNEYKDCNLAVAEVSNIPQTVALSSTLSRSVLKITLHNDVAAALTSRYGQRSALIFRWSVADNGDVFGNADPYGNSNFGHVGVSFASISENKDDQDVQDVNFINNGAQYGFGQSLTYDMVVTTANASQYAFRTGDSDNDNKPHFPISALPFRAYEFIYNYFFRNERVVPFEKNSHPVFNEFITNDGDGADTSTPIDFFNAPYEYDLFTTCVKTPQFGHAPLVGITTNDNTATFLMQDVSVTGDDSGNYAIQTDTRNGRIVGITNYDEVADKSSVMRLQEAIQFGISINDFRNVNALQRFQERMLKAGTKYQNIVFEFFGTNPPIGEEFPEYIGGTTSNISVSKVTSMADTGDKGLGGYVGSGRFSAKGKSIRCFCAEQSYIMGIMYFTCTPAYSQMLPRHFTKSRFLDFYNPQFANIGLQPVYSHQLIPLQLPSGQEGKVFGYNRPFAEYVSMQDEVHGDFRESMSNYLLQRVFTDAELSQAFLEIHPEDTTNVFCDTSDNDKIYGQIYFDCRAKLPIPRFAVPRII